LGIGISGASNLLQQDNFSPMITSTGAGLGDFTLICLANPVAEARISSGVESNSFTDEWLAGIVFNCSVRSTITSGSFCFKTDNMAATVADVAGAVDGGYHLFAGRRRGTEHNAWVDGVSRTTVTGTVRDVYDTSTDFGIGQRANDAADRIATTTNIVLAAAWNRALSNMEMRALGRDPFVMFRARDVERLWAAGEGVLSPTDLSDGFGFETPAVSQTHVLSAAEPALAFGFETPAVSQSHVLSAAEAALAFGFEAPALFTGFVLSPAKAALAFGFEALAVLQSHVLSAAEAALAFGFETPPLSQAHYLFAADAVLAEYYDMAGLVQLHALGAHEMNFGLPFDLATLVKEGQGAPGFRTRGIGKNPRGENIAAHTRSTPIEVDSRSKSIRE